METATEKVFSETPIDALVDLASMGGGLRLMSKETQELNAKFAKELLEDYDEWIAERNLRDKHVDSLKTAMERGSFIPYLCTIVTCRCREDGKNYRLNGQHTAWARFSADPEKMRSQRLPVNVLKWRAETLEDVRRLYATIDRNKPRVMSDVMMAYMYQSEEFSNVSRFMLRKLSQGYSLWRWERRDERAKIDGDARAFFMKNEHHHLCTQVLKIFDECPYKANENSHIYRSACVGAMFEIANRAGINRAKEFWKMVSDGVGFTSKFDPAFKLRHKLLTTSVGHISKHKSAMAHVSAEEMYRWCIYAFNAWVNGRELKQVRTSMDSARPKAVSK